MSERAYFVSPVNGQPKRFWYWRGRKRPVLPSAGTAKRERGRPRASVLGDCILDALSSYRDTTFGDLYRTVVDNYGRTSERCVYARLAKLVAWGEVTRVGPAKPCGANPGLYRRVR